MRSAAAQQLVSGQAAGRANRLPLFSLTPIRLLRYWSPRQWRTAVEAACVAFLAIGTVGQTLPWTASGRTFPIVWWNYVTLAASSLLIGLIVATFAVAGARRRSRAGGAASTGVAGTAAAIAMACPVCNPIAIPLLGAGGIFAFLQPDRGLIALASVVILAFTLALRLRATASCRIRRQYGPELRNVSPEAK
jgi:hypothetical protein